MDLAQCFFVPDTDSVLAIQNISGEPRGAFDYEIRNYTNEVVCHGTCVPDENGLASIYFSLPRGYYEIWLPAYERTIGLFGAEPFSGECDEFFGLDYGASWFVEGTKEDALLGMLRRGGVSSLRERLSYKEIGTALENGETWKDSVPNRYVSRRRYQKIKDFKILDCFHDAPAYTGADPSQWNWKNYPQDLLRVNADWRVIFSHLGDFDSEMEIWNEPDGFSRGPASFLVSLTKTIAYCNSCSEKPIPIVGGVFSELASEDFIECAGLDGLVDCVDAISFHTYSGPVEVEKQIRFYRDWLSRHGRESLPIYITEGGRPFSQNVWWDEANSAVWISAKSAVAKACGLAKMYPFFAHDYRQGPMMFAMLHADGTPRRPMAAYLAQISKLANCEYIGNIPAEDPSLVTIPVFKKGIRIVAVPISLRVQKTNAVTLNAPVIDISGIDGRPMKCLENGCIPLPDGMAYLSLDPEKADAFIIRDTPYMDLWQRSRKTLSSPNISPAVLAFRPDTGQMLHDMLQTDGFYVTPEAIDAFELSVDCNNLGKKEMEGSLKLVLPNGVTVLEKPSCDTFAVPGVSKKAVSWKLDLSNGFRNCDVLPLRVEWYDLDGTLLDAVSPVIRREKQRPEFRASARGDSIVIDGRISDDEWGNAKPVRLVHPENSAFYAEARFAWSPTGFCFAYTVHDSEHIQTGEPALCWQQDCIQFAAFGEDSQGNGTHYEYGLSLADGKARWSRWLPDDQLPAGLQDAELVIRRDEENGVTVYEGRMPWNCLAPIQPVPNSAFGFTFCVMNCDATGGKMSLEWTDGINHGGKNPADFGKIYLYDLNL